MAQHRDARMEFSTSQILCTWVRNIFLLFLYVTLVAQCGWRKWSPVGEVSIWTSVRQNVWIFRELCFPRRLQHILASCMVPYARIKMHTLIASPMSNTFTHTGTRRRITGVQQATRCVHKCAHDSIGRIIQQLRSSVRVGNTQVGTYTCMKTHTWTINHEKVKCSGPQDLWQSQCSECTHENLTSSQNRRFRKVNENLNVQQYFFLSLVEPSR